MSVYSHAPVENISALLNTPVYRTDLFLPYYKKLLSSQWKITQSEYALDHGYYSGTWLCESMPVLLRKSATAPTQWETWMSLSAHEIESQELGCRYAFGHTVVMGMGMGWFALNTALNPKVEKVTIVEMDPEVISLFHQSGVQQQLPEAAADKIVLEQGDALNWTPDSGIDFLYADIWKNITEPATTGDVVRMQDNINAKQVYFWGQELALFEASGISASAITDFNQSLLMVAKEKLGLPLLIPNDIDYADMIKRVVRNRIKRRLHPQWRELATAEYETGQEV